MVFDWLIDWIVVFFFFSSLSISSLLFIRLHASNHIIDIGLGIANHFINKNLHTHACTLMYPSVPSVHPQNASTVHSDAEILNSVAIHKRLMLDYLTENCALNLTSASNRSSPLSLSSSCASIFAPISAAITPSSSSARIANIYSCLNKCGHSYDSLSSLQHHMRLECTSATAAAAPVIDTTTPSPRHHQPSILKKLLCIYCKETFTSRDHLELHTLDKHHSLAD